MARKARDQAEGEVYHLIQRGLNKIKIFADDEDKEIFLNTIKEKKERYYVKIFGYIVMDNHYHIIAKPQLLNLSRFMMSVNTTYAKYWVKKEGWRGRVYHDRFKSIRIKTEEQLLQSIRYIHLNRVRVFKDEGLDEYLYSGHAEIIGKVNRGIIEKDKFLDLFEGNMEAYKKFIEEGIKQDPSEVRKMIYQDISDIETQRKLLPEERLGEHLGSKIEKYRWVYEIEKIKGEIRGKRKLDLLKAIAREEGISMEGLRRKGIKNRRVVQAKRLMCFIGRNYLDYQLREIAGYLGVHEIALLRGTKKIEDLVRKGDEKTLSKIDKILHELKRP